MDGNTQLSAIFRALTHPARLDILMALRDGEQCVCHLEAHLGYRQAYISQQLGVLREAGLIGDRRDGWNIYYHVIQPGVFDLIGRAAALTGTTPLEPRPSDPALCPCPKCAGLTGAERPSNAETQSIKTNSDRRKDMLTIKVLGHGCQNCQKVEKAARQAMADLRLDANIEKVTEDSEIFKYPIMSTPGLVVNEKLVCAGRIPSQAEVAKWLKDAAASN
jgi:small redox-active disulfide protein 2